jgi:VanZ family protein
LRHGVADATMTIGDGYGAAAMNADVKSPFRAGAKVLSVAIMVLLVVGALGPANWTPRTALGWQIDHFLGYFAITLFICFAWPRPLVVGGVLIAAAFLLEGLQAFSPGRSANLVAALCYFVSAHFLVALPASKSYERRVRASSRGRSTQSAEVRFISGAPRRYIILFHFIPVLTARKRG